MLQTIRIMSWQAVFRPSLAVRRRYLMGSRSPHGKSSVGGNGGGMYNDHSSPTVTNCMFTGNSGYSGGGMYNDHSSPTVTNCTFSGNSGDGGGMLNASGSPTVINCTFSGNSG